MSSTTAASNLFEI
ncbi:unnamed protein product, partial [Rotaria sordida]